MTAELDRILRADYDDAVTAAFGPPPAWLDGYTPPSRTRGQRIQRAALEATARIRMAWQILVHGEHQY